MTFGTPAIGSLDLSMLDGVAGGSVGGAQAPAEPTKGVAGFGDVLRGKLEQLDSSQAVGKQAANDLATGRIDDVAQTMMRVEQANVSLQLATQVRNKAIEAYQEILRMQI